MKTIKLEAATRLQAEIAVFAMSNLTSSDTGLPNSIFLWVSTKAGAKHGPRIKVSNTRGHFNDSDTFSVTISDDPSIPLSGGTPKRFKPYELDSIYQWIALNKDFLLMWWNSTTLSSNVIYENIIKL